MPEHHPFTSSVTNSAGSVGSFRLVPRKKESSRTNREFELDPLKFVVVPLSAVPAYAVTPSAASVRVVFAGIAPWPIVKVVAPAAETWYRPFPAESPEIVTMLFTARLWGADVVTVALPVPTTILISFPFAIDHVVVPIFHAPSELRIPV